MKLKRKMLEEIETENFMETSKENNCKDDLDDVLKHTKKIGKGKF